MLRATARTLAVAAPTLAILVGCELALRVFTDAPTGWFDFLRPPMRAGLFPPSTTQRNDWGAAPHTLSTNELGLRRTSPGALPSRSRGRIVAIGDSVTHGFFVDDVDTWPYRLQQSLDDDPGPGWQVLNAARGGASLPKELAILREIALPLTPDLVLLTFVSNDLAELRDGLREAPDVHPLPRAGDLPLHERLGIALATRTALGEWLLRLYWERFLRGPIERTPIDETRYRIAGGNAFDANVRLFLDRHGNSDGMLLHERPDEATRALLARYEALLEQFASACRSGGADAVLLYFPAYPQIYRDDAPGWARDALRAAAERSGLGFLDLTPAFRAARERVLHLAPRDFHLNPEGNRIFADAVAGFLRESGRLR